MNRKYIFLASVACFCFLFVVGMVDLTVVSSDNMVYAAADQAGDHASSDPLSFDTLKKDLALWSLVIFLVLVAVLGKFAFRPIADALDAREKAVNDQITSAAQANEEAKNILSQYQQKLADSKGEVRDILESARKDAQRSADGIVEKAKEAAQLEHQRAMKEIEAATVNALQSIAEKSATLATDLAGKMIRKEVTPDVHRDLIKGAMDEFAKN